MVDKTDFDVLKHIARSQSGWEICSILYFINLPPFVNGGKNNIANRTRDVLCASSGFRHKKQFHSDFEWEPGLTSSEIRRINHVYDYAFLALPPFPKL